MDKFLALDFETANRTNRHSVCSVGIAVVENGRITDEIYSLINPEEHFDDLNIQIHGITERDVKNAPTFPEFYEKVRSSLEGAPVFAHNMSFDGYVLRDVLQKYNITSASHMLLCTYKIARSLWKNYDSYSLGNLCKRRGIILPQHHHAMNDAVACAEIFLQLQNEFALHSIAAIEEKTGFLHGEISPTTFRSFSKGAAVRKDKGLIFPVSNKPAKKTNQSKQLVETVMTEKNIMPPQGEFFHFVTRAEYEELGRLWGLFGAKAKEQFLYKGNGIEEPITLAGYQTYGNQYTIVIQFEDGTLGCIHPAYLKEMQAKAFKRTLLSE